MLLSSRTDKKAIIYDIIYELKTTGLCKYNLQNLWNDLKNSLTLF